MNTISTSTLLRISKADDDDKLGKIQDAATLVVQVFEEFMKCSVSGGSRVGVLLSFCILILYPFSLLERQILLQN